jgi:hypothetical protein
MLAITGIKKRDLLLVAYHLFSAIAVVYFMKSGNFKSGPCTPDLDVLGFFLALLISIVLTLVGIVMLIKSRQNKYFLIINLTAMLIWLSILFWNS